MFYPIDPSEMYGVFAIRLEKYKAHFYTQGSKCFTCTSSYFNIKAQAAFLALFFFYFLCIRVLLQQHHPRPRLHNICKPKGPRPPSSVWPGDWSVRALPSLTGRQTWPARGAGKDQESQGAVWRLHGVWRKPDIQRNRPEPGAVLQPWVWAQTVLLPLLMGRVLASLTGQRSLLHLYILDLLVIHCWRAEAFLFLEKANLINASARKFFLNWFD